MQLLENILISVLCTKLVKSPEPPKAVAAAVKVAERGQHINKAEAKAIRQKQRAEKRTAQVVRLPENCRIDERCLTTWTPRSIERASVDLILTDPMYDKNSVWQYLRIAELAAHCLKPGAWCLAYCGKMFMDLVHEGMMTHLEYGWTWDVMHAQPTLIDLLQIEQNGKYIVGYRNFAEPTWWHPLTDRLEYEPEKFAGKLQQPLGEAEYLIRGLCPAGGVVFDPMLGTGTTAVAAIKNGMQFVGGDIDPDMVRIANERVARVDGRCRTRCSHSA